MLPAAHNPNQTAVVAGDRLALRSGGPKEEFCKEVWPRNVRAVSGWDLDRFDAEPLASLPALPIWMDRAIVCGDDIARGAASLWVIGPCCGSERNRPDPDLLAFARA